MEHDEIVKMVNKLENFEMNILDVPEEIQYDKRVIAAERKFGLRKELRRGYDIIHNYFFVEEELFYKNLGEKVECYQKYLTFENFNDYFNYLDGDIYENACYQYLNIDKYITFFEEKDIDINKLMSKESFLSETIDDISLEISKEELREYDEVESRKDAIKEWIVKFENCTSGLELEKIIKTYSGSYLKESIDVSFFLYCYINNDINNIKFHALMDYLSTGKYYNADMLNGLCSVYNPDDVIQCYQYYGMGQQKQYRYKKKIKDYIKLFDDGKINIYTNCFYDKETHFFCEEKKGVENERLVLKSLRRKYFDTFDDFIDYRKGDLRDTDLSEWIVTGIDFSKYIIDETTYLPIFENGNLICKISKEYKNEKFYVQKQWSTKEGSLIKRNEFTTPYFFDFVYYLKGDLTNSFLLYCDGLSNLLNYKSIDFRGAVLSSSIADRFGIAYEKYQVNSEKIEKFELIEKNENEKPLFNCKLDRYETYIDHKLIHNYSLIKENNVNCRRIYYVSDIHLMHKIMEKKCKSWNDVEYLIQEIIDNIIDETGRLLLIGGDISSEFSVFKCFVDKLYEKIQEDRYGEVDVIFILGNHELWAFPQESVDVIVETYRKLIEAHGMYLLQNELIYNDNNKLYMIDNRLLVSLTAVQLRKKLQNANLVILGGIGFSGYNNTFNANMGIYRDILNRNQEIEATKKFEELYNAILPSIRDKNTVIFTHMPKKDWCIDGKPFENFIYINGHTHRNEFYDDGVYRVYADNQIGYSNKKTHLKCFLIDERYDIFSDYSDGIYEITSKQYMDFYRGRNIYMEFTRKIHILYMLKKSGYYCFIHKAKSGKLCILNGGALKGLEKQNIEYYYNYMDDIIEKIKTPLDKYTHIQYQISDIITRLGGSGNIHGCIIDIDFYSHIYVNPIDFTVTGYWATDIVNKIVYPQVPGLLKDHCPEIYENFCKLEKNDGQNLAIFEPKKYDINILPQEYRSTDIYQLSREIKKIQKLSSNILCLWNENICQPRDNLLE